MYKKIKSTIIFTLIFSFIFSLSVSFIACAEDTTYAPYVQITDDNPILCEVYDYADLLTNEEEEALKSLYSKKAKFEKNNYSVIFLTYNDAEGKSTMAYTDDFYDTHRFSTSGILLAIDMDNREIYINTVGKCIKAYTDKEIEYVLDKTFSLATNENYFECLSKMFKLSESSIFGNIAFVQALHPTQLLAYAILLFSIFVLVTAYKDSLPNFLQRLLRPAVPTSSKSTKTNSSRSSLAYPPTSFKITDKKITPLPPRTVVLHDYYAPSESNGGGGSSSHSSGGGVSHGGGGHSF